MSDGVEFCWRDAEREGAVVLPEQPAVAVYWNPRGELVIRQRATDPCDDDPFVLVAAVNLPLLIEALQREQEGLTEPSPWGEPEPRQDLPQRQPADPTAAERQRRRRARQRVGGDE